ncbi:pentapeptide repeat-containing protein [Streptomyces avermitilis]
MADRTVEEALRGLLYLTCPDAPDDARSKALAVLADANDQLSDDEAALLTRSLSPLATKGARVDLRHADLRGTDLRNADLHRANLAGADLRGTDLRNADLHRANLAGADLRGTDLRDADLRHAHWVDRVRAGAGLAGAAALTVGVWLPPVRLIYGAVVAAGGAGMVREVLAALEGAQWSTGTRWPTTWKPLILWVSIATSPITYVVGRDQAQEAREHSLR